ncbi:MAG: TetR family transcriptional regulator [Micromonosporaceae bacterium]
MTGSLRDALLEAATALLASRGYRGLRMEDVGAAAGVSRQTVYNEFGSKRGLARAVLLRHTEQFLDGIDETLSQHSDMATAVAAAVSYTLREAADDPLLKAALTGDGNEGMLPLLTTQAEPQLFAARARIVAHVSRQWPQLPQADVAELTDAVIRLTMSHMMMPTDPPQVVAARLARLATGFFATGQNGRVESARA